MSSLIRPTALACALIALMTLIGCRAQPGRADTSTGPAAQNSPAQQVQPPPAPQPVPIRPVPSDTRAPTPSNPAPAPPSKTAATPAKPQKPSPPAATTATATATATTAAPKPAATAAVPAPAPPSKAPPPKAASLDLNSLEQRLKDTRAIGVFTKLSLKNQVDDLLDELRDFHKGSSKNPQGVLRQKYDLLIMKVLSLLQDGDAPLASAIASSREAIWQILMDPTKFATI